MVAAADVVSVSSIVSKPVSVARGAAERVVWDFSCKPAGPLGWVSSHWVGPALSRPLYQSLADNLGLSREDELLEVACGSGAFLIAHADHVHRVAGVDLSEMQVDLAHKRLESRIAAGTAEILLGDADTLPWPDESFSVVASMAAFELFPDPDQVLAEVFRVLQPGGRIVLTMGQRVPPGTETHKSLGFWVWTEDDVRTMVDRAGFSGIAIKYIPSYGTGRVASTLTKVFGSWGSDSRLVAATRPSGA